MGRKNKSLEGVEDVVKPITLEISEALWDKFKILATTKNITLNDFLVKLIASEVELKKDALIAIQSQ